jgi:hypothetical protein
MDSVQAIEKLDHELANNTDFEHEELMAIHDRRLELIKVAYSIKRDEERLQAEYNSNIMAMAILGTCIPLLLAGTIVLCKYSR